MTTGVSGYYSDIRSIQFEDHKGRNASYFFQIEKKFFKKLSTSLGVRLEYFSIDSVATESNMNIFDQMFGKRLVDRDLTSPIHPVARIGLNYQVHEATYIRGSFGQGYRFPTIAEKYVFTQRSGITVFPNYLVTPETGISAELGIKQGFKISKWLCFVDLAAFITQYKDMMDFTFGFYLPDTINGGYRPLAEGESLAPDQFETAVGFQSQNVTDSRISGVEISTLGTGKIFNIPVNFIIGYVYINPVDLNSESKPKLFHRADSVNLLEFRSRHSAKADIETSYKGVNLGVSLVYNSFIEKLPDVTAQLAPGIAEYRSLELIEKKLQGDITLDIRAGYDITEDFKVNLICKNVLNREYTVRPGKLEPPRNISLQLAYNLK